MIRERRAGLIGRNDLYLRGSDEFASRGSIKKSVRRVGGNLEFR